MCHFLPHAVIDPPEAFSGGLTMFWFPVWVYSFLEQYQGSRNGANQGLTLLFSHSGFNPDVLAARPAVEAARMVSELMVLTFAVPL